MQTYGTQFFDDFQEASRRSARAVLPRLLDLLHPNSIVDVGCGEGIWLSIAAQRGARILGLDGSYVDRTRLTIPPDSFRAHDLMERLPDLDRSDLALCLETAEHLDPTRADSLVGDLVRLAPVVLFSSAAPHQGGTHHVNEQWPSYWVAKFSQCGFTCIDCIRPVIWNDPEVCWYYRQNMFLAVRTEFLAERPELQELAGKHGTPLDVVHPDMYRQMWQSMNFFREIRNHSLKHVASRFPGMVIDWLRGARLKPGKSAPF